ncbi:hypothetical protein ACTWQR_32420 [Streptomyces sp. 2A115]
MTTHRLLRALAAQRGTTTGMLKDEDPVLASRRRLAADAEQVARARADRFEGPEMHRLTDRLWAYGVTALNRGMRDSSLTSRVRAAAERMTSFSLEGGRQRLFDVDTRIALAVQTVLDERHVGVTADRPRCRRGGLREPLRRDGRRTGESPSIRASSLGREEPR